jgi:hypothetical protein
MASVFGFLSSYGKEKLKDVQANFTERLVAWDPNTATQAEIEEMIKELDKVTVEAGKAQADFLKEKKEADAARANYNNHLAAAEVLQQRIAGGESGDVEKSLEKLIGTLETMLPEVTREEEEAVEAESYFNDVKEIAQITADKVKTARKTLEDAHRDMKKAEMAKQKAEVRAAKAEQLAGLRKDTSNLGIALKAMQNQTTKAAAEAAASEMKSTLLSGMKDEDTNIKNALQQVSGAPTQTSSLADRLAALKK